MSEKKFWCNMIIVLVLLVCAFGLSLHDAVKEQVKINNVAHA